MKTRIKGSDELRIAIAHLTTAKIALQSKKNKSAKLRMTALIEIKALENTIGFLEEIIGSFKK